VGFLHQCATWRFLILTTVRSADGARCHNPLCVMHAHALNDFICMAGLAN